MATYYKYAERAAGSQVNWAEIGKNLTDTLNEENKLREQKKAAIDEASRQYGITLETSPQGEDRSLNQWGLDFAGDAQEARLLQDRLLKSGKLKLKDYTMMRQNLTDGTKVAFDLLNEYNAEKKVREERAKSMDPATASQYLERWMAAQAQSFANFKETKLYINPTTFSVSVGKNFTTDKGVTTMSDNPNDYTTVNELRNRIKTQFNKFDSSGYLKKRVDMLGDVTKAKIKDAATKSKTGWSETIEDKTARADFDAIQTQIIDQAFADPLNISSVLTENVKMDKDGNIYDFTFDDKEAGVIDAKAKKNYIYMKRNDDGTYEPQFSEAQKEAATKDMKTQMNSMFDYKETVQAYTNPTPAQALQWQVEFNKNKEMRLGLANMLLKLKNGTQAEVQAAVDYFRLVNPKGIREIERWGDPSNGNGGVTYINVDGATNYLTRNDNDADWIRAAAGAFLPEGTSLDDVVDDAIKTSGGTSTWDNYGPISNRATQVVQPATQDANTNFWNSMAIPGVPGSGGSSVGGSGTGQAGTF
tara:strand:- start:5038 stop:6627 length:1590 start_codon:yes stop_codon:yes gene_type:complete